MIWCARPLDGKPEKHSPHPLEPLVQGRSLPRFSGACSYLFIRRCFTVILCFLKPCWTPFAI